jgi:hypothetical protein
MYWLALIISLIFTLFLAGKDASSYLLRGMLDPYQGVTKSRLDRWHRDGVAIHAIFVFVLAWATGLWITVPAQALLIRLGFYDIAFNKWASLPTTYIGNTSGVDRIFLKIFGHNGAVKKSAAFLIILLLWGVLRIFL